MSVTAAIRLQSGDTEGASNRGVSSSTGGDKTQPRTLLVDEEEIISATELIYSRLKLAVEPSAGTGLAAVRVFFPVSA